MIARAISILMLAIIGILGILMLSMIPNLIHNSRASRGPILFLGMIWIGMVTGFVVVVLSVSRRRAMTVLSYLEQAVRLNLPLPSVLQSIGEAEGGRFATHMQQARIVLEQGAPLSVVLGTIRQMPRRIVSIIETAERNGRLNQVLTRLMDQRRRAMAPRPWDQSFYRAYPWLLVISLITMTSMMMVFVVPKFEVIFKDFRVPLPWITLVTLSISRSIGPIPGFLIIIVCVVFFVHAVSSLWNDRLPIFSRDWLSRAADRLPWVGSIRMQDALATVLDSTADAIDSGQPLDAALTEARQMVTNAPLRSRIGVWIDQMHKGKSVAEAARAAAMPALIHGMLAGAVQTPNVAAVLRFLGRYYSAKFSRATILLSAALVPAVALFMGFLVGWIALSMMTPLIRLIDATNPYPQGM